MRIIEIFLFEDHISERNRFEKIERAKKLYEKNERRRHRKKIINFEKVKKIARLFSINNVPLIVYIPSLTLLRINEIIWNFFDETFFFRKDLKSI